MAGGEIGQRSPTSLVDTGDDLPKPLNNVGVADLVKHPPEFPALGPGVPPAPSPSAKPPVDGGAHGGLEKHGVSVTRDGHVAL
jgi:hypothetical protein